MVMWNWVTIFLCRAKVLVVSGDQLIRFPSWLFSTSACLFFFF